MPKVTLQSVAQTERAGLFSICFEGESYSEFEKFIRKYKDDAYYSRDMQVILAAIARMMNSAGFLERYFRPEGKMQDNLAALPITTGHLRLYCLRLSDQILIAGNGGVKSVRRYEDSPELAGYVLTLQKLDEALKVAIKKGNITIEETTISDIDDIHFSL